MKLWLDDRRPAPEDWTLVKTVHDAIALLEQGNVDAVSLDNYLGTDQPEGYEVAVWIRDAAIRGSLGRMTLFAHTKDKEACKRMNAVFRATKKAWNEHDAQVEKKRGKGVRRCPE